MNDTKVVRETTTKLGNTVQRDTEVQDPNTDAAHTQNIMERIVYLIFGILEGMLLVRFVLSLLGANTTNSFANLIYSTTEPLVAPFFSLFSYSGYQYGVSRFEVYTLIAMLVYSLIAWLIIYLVNINRK